MLDRVKHIIETKHQLVLFIVIAFTLLFTMFVPAVEFRTKIEDFYPENDAVQADRTIEVSFSPD